VRVRINDFRRLCQVLFFQICSIKLLFFFIHICLKLIQKVLQFDERIIFLNHYNFYTKLNKKPPSYLPMRVYHLYIDLIYRFSAIRVALPESLRK
jgi:hypothetical protein